MSHSTISIPSDCTDESVESSPSLVILLDTEAEVMVVPTILPEITLEAKAVVVASPIAILDLVIESDPKADPFEALPSPNYLEEPFEDNAPEAAKPLPDQVAPPPAVQINPTSLTEPTPAPPVISHDTQATARMTVHPKPTLPLGYRAAIARSLSVAPSLPHSNPSRKRSRYLSPSSSSGTSHSSSSPLPRRRHRLSSYFTPPASVGPSRWHHQRGRTHLYAPRLSDESSRVSLRIARTGLAEMRRQVRDTAEQLHQ
ncbi:hypothetical protein Tco_1442156, partial [Tanacetum coccineum]